MRLSVIIPFLNEEANVDEVLRQVQAVCPDAEILAVDDGSTDGTLARLTAASGVTVVALARTSGQSAALHAGLIRARGEVCVMLDGDGQNDPADIPSLLDALHRADAACGYRVARCDGWRRRLGSWLANVIRRAWLKDGVRDTCCSLKALRREHVRFLVPFDGMHRYIPAMLRNAGLSVTEVPVRHRPRRYGISKYTLAGRAARGLRDLAGVRWLLARRRHFPAEVLGATEDARRPNDG